MAEYIERESALDAISEIINTGFVEDRFIMPDELRTLQNEFETFPAADVAPVVHGAWEVYEQEENQKLCKCKNCNEVLLVCDGWNAVHKLPNYCPFCGAKMDLEE